jgi:hypothetical protein
MTSTIERLEWRLRPDHPSRGGTVEVYKDGDMLTLVPFGPPQGVELTADEARKLANVLLMLADDMDGGK